MSSPNEGAMDAGTRPRVFAEVVGPERGATSGEWFPERDPAAWLRARRSAVDPSVLPEAMAWVERVRHEGEVALRESAVRFDGRLEGEPLVLERTALRAALDRTRAEDRALLERCAERIERFARAQRAALAEVDVAVPGGRAGQTWIPVERAGCYAPGGRYPLPSSVLMTAVTARVAGVGDVTVACPAATDAVAAAAAIAGADRLLLAGGAAAIGALAYGVEVPPSAVPPCDVVVGPGNAWVTAAKFWVSRDVGIDFLAGPTELLVVADEEADPAWVAADLLAQAEHDPRALPLLVCLSRSLLDRTRSELRRQLEELPGAEVARAALRNGGAAIVTDREAAVSFSNRLAPEHVALHVADAAAWRAALRNYGALFVGPRSAEVLGDYGAGPNHTLPTGGSARATGGLSVLHFLRAPTWLEMQAGASEQELLQDAAALARMEGLEAHARSALARLRGS